MKTSVFGLTASALLISGLLGGCTMTPSGQTGQLATVLRGELAMGHVKYLSQTVGNRIQGTPKEAEARQYIYSQLKAIGYSPEIQPFDVTYKNAAGETKVRHSANVYALKKGQSDKEVVVVAHMDTVSKGTGADDNGSGVAVILEAAQALKNQNTPYSIRFLLVSAEESYKDAEGFKGGGSKGSEYYVSQMSKAAIANTAFVVNLDSLLAGDEMFIYGSEGKAGYVRDAALNIAKMQGYTMKTSPAYTGKDPSESFPAGSTGDWSDHAAFKAQGIPYAYFEATNWNIGDKDGYTQTEKLGGVWHTDNDNIDILNKTFPGRAQQHLTAFSDVLIRLLQNPPVQPQ